MRIQQLLDRITKTIGTAEHYLHALEGDVALSAMGPSCDMYITTGMLELCEIEDEVAGIILHEVAHSVAQHAFENIGRTFIVFFSLFPLFGVYGMVIIGTVWSLARQQGNEHEADRMATIFTAEAGFRAEGLVYALGSLMRVQEAGKLPKPVLPEALRSHPPSRERVKTTREIVPEAIWTNGLCGNDGTAMSCHGGEDGKPA